MNKILQKYAEPLESYGLKSYVATITPKVAKQLLEEIANPNNRTVSEKVVANFSREMQNDHWALNGESLVIQSDGILANGHNRLNAVIKSGVPVRFTVYEGVEPDCFATYDGGMRRKAAHVLQMEQISNATNVAALISAIYVYRGALKRNGSFNTFHMPTNTEIVEEYNLHPAMYQLAVKLAKKSQHVCCATYIAMVYAYALIDLKYDYETVADFAESFATGAMLADGNPILTLRNALLRAKSERKTGGASKSAHWFKNACIVCWNSAQEGRELKLIRFADVNKAIQIV
jgi:hypothetical protein